MTKNKAFSYIAPQGVFLGPNKVFVRTLRRLTLRGVLQ
jgi:hypothetical protein